MAGKEPDVDTLIEAAERHGKDSEPDHEVGDLQQLLRAAWGLMTPDQRQALLVSPEAEDVLMHGGEPEGGESLSP